MQVTVESSAVGAAQVVSHPSAGSLFRSNQPAVQTIGAQLAAALSHDRVAFGTLEREMLEITAFEHPHDYGEHFKARYGPTITAHANARRTEREAEFEEALNRFCDEWNLGTPDHARFEQEYLLAVGTRA